MPVYRLLREPKHLEEFEWETNRKKIICCDNDTVICVCSRDWLQYDDASYARFIMEKVGQHYLRGAIFGKSDATIAETAAWFRSLLTQILGSNPTRCVSFIANQLTTDQSVLLATRPYLLDLELNRYATDEGLSDEGTAFVDALENRRPSLLERLLRLDSIIDSFKLDYQLEDVV
jgi:hypothetical protein